MSIKRVVLYPLIALGSVFLFLAAMSAVAHLTESLDPSFKLVSVWSERGTEPGQLNYPAGIQIHNDQIFVADVNSHRIQVFDLNGNYIRHFGEEGGEPGQLKRPFNLVFSGDELVVAAYPNNRVDVFEENGTFKRSLGVLGDDVGSFNGAVSVVEDNSGNFWVADFYNHRVVIVNSQGEYVSQLGTTGQPSAGNDEFNYPFGLAKSPDGELIYILDSGNDRIKVYGSDGKFKSKWGGPFARNSLMVWFYWFPFDGWLSRPSAIAVDNDGNVFVGDRENQRVQVFTAQGEHLSSFGAPQGENEIGEIGGFAFADDGSVLVVNQSNFTIQRWKRNSPLAN